MTALCARATGAHSMEKARKRAVSKQVGRTVNRILPTALDHPWLDEWKSAQKAHLETIADAFAPRR